MRRKTFAPNNFCALMDNSLLPIDFHLAQDFLASSPIGFELTEPTIFYSHLISMK